MCRKNGYITNLRLTTHCFFLRKKRRTKRKPIGRKLLFFDKNFQFLSKNNNFRPIGFLLVRLFFRRKKTVRSESQICYTPIFSAHTFISKNRYSHFEIGQMR